MEQNAIIEEGLCITRPQTILLARHFTIAMHPRRLFPMFGWFLTYFIGDTSIYCGAISLLTNAYFLGKDVLNVDKCGIF